MSMASGWNIRMRAPRACMRSSNSSGGKPVGMHADGDPVGLPLDVGDAFDVANLLDAARR